jgi:hypothetical protein
MAPALLVPHEFGSVNFWSNLVAPTALVKGERRQVAAAETLQVP